MAQKMNTALALALTISLTALAGTTGFAASVGGRSTGNQGSSSGPSHSSAAPHASDVADYVGGFCVNRCPPRPRPRPRPVVEHSNRCSSAYYLGDRRDCRPENF